MIYQIEERIKIWRMSLRLSREERALWKRTKKELSRKECRNLLTTVGKYLTKRDIEKMERNRGTVPEKRRDHMRASTLILPNPWALGSIEKIEKMMEREERKRWLEMKKDLDRMPDTVSEIVRRYAIMKRPVQVRTVRMSENEG